MHPNLNNELELLSQVLRPKRLAQKTHNSLLEQDFKFNEQYPNTAEALADSEKAETEPEPLDARGVNPKNFLSCLSNCAGCNSKCPGSPDYLPF